MKLLLTSNGISNKSIERALRELLGKDFSKCSVSFIPTAANDDSIAYEDKGWLIKDLASLYKLGFKNFYLVDLQVLKKERIAQYLSKSDVIVVGGGNTFYLTRWVKKTGLIALLPKLLGSRVYVGISAGSMIACKEVQFTAKQIQEIYYEKSNRTPPGFGFDFVNIHFRAHLNSRWFPLVNERVLRTIAQKIDIPMYALDNQMALKVIDKKITPVGKGKYLLYPGK